MTHHSSKNLIQNTQQLLLEKLAHFITQVQNEELQYCYIAGSFNTPFFNKNSDLNLVMVWKQIPHPMERDRILSELSQSFKCKFMWKYLDDNLQNPKDVINLQNLRKFEIVHFIKGDFKKFSQQLQDPICFESHYYSIKTRVTLFANAEFESFIDFQLPQLIDQEQMLRNYLAKLMTQKLTATSEATQLIFKLVFLKTLKAIPTNKYWEKSLHKISLSPELKKMLSQILKIKNAHNLKNWLQRNKLKLVHELL